MMTEFCVFCELSLQCTEAQTKTLHDYCIVIMAEMSAQKTSSLSTCDQSTQTESPQLQSLQTQSTQTSPTQGEHTPSTESKSTQTKQSSFPLKQAYWGKSFTDQSADQQKPQLSSRNSYLTVISWNIDGLDLDNVFDRLKGLLSLLGK